MKADKKSNNKRLVTGLAILMTLVGLNLIVRFTRRGATPTGTPAALPLPATVAPTDNLAGQAAQRPAQQPERRALPRPVTPGAAVVKHDSKLAVQDKLNFLRQRFEEIPALNDPPDFNIKLELSQFDRFRWQLPIVADPVAVPEPIVEVATISRFVKILGTFRIRGRDRLLIQEDDWVYLVHEADKLASDSIAFERLNGETFLVRDSTGATHDLMGARLEDEGLVRAIEVLTGQVFEQPAFNINPEGLPEDEGIQLQAGMKGR